MSGRQIEEIIIDALNEAGINSDSCGVVMKYNGEEYQLEILGTYCNDDDDDDDD